MIKLIQGIPCVFHTSEMTDKISSGDESDKVEYERFNMTMGKRLRGRGKALAIKREMDFAGLLAELLRKELEREDEKEAKRAAEAPGEKTSGSSRGPKARKTA